MKLRIADCGLWNEEEESSRVEGFVFGFWAKSVVEERSKITKRSACILCFVFNPHSAIRIPQSQEGDRPW
jgi:hypothetical protein